MATDILKIPREVLTSSNIASAGYDPERSILAIEFTSGAIYHFGSVTLEDAVAFYGSESKGRYFNQQIKGKFPGAKVTGDCPACGDRHGWIGETCDACGCADYMDGRTEHA